MNDSDVAISRAIHSRRRTLSLAVVERQYELHPELRERYGERGREKCIEDTEFHLAHLSSAILASSPTIFADYIGWVRSVMSASGIRPEDVRSNLVSLQAVFAEQMPMKMAIVAGSYIESALERLLDLPGSPSHLPQDGVFAEVSSEYLRLLLACERHAASCFILDAVDSGMAIRDVYLQVFQPCQRELGRLWQARQITVAQEHYCTAATQLIMSQLAPRLFTTRKKGHRAVIACVTQETHEVGTRMVADLLELAGWDTMYLGGNVPIRDVVQVLVEHKADLLAASATMMYHLPAVIDLIAAVRAEPACSGVKIMVGGRLFHEERDLWQRVGADGHAVDADEAVSLAASLMGSSLDGATGVEPETWDSNLATVPPTPDRTPGSLYDELSCMNCEVVALNRDLARKNAEVERLHADVCRQALDLQQADRRKNEFLAILGHELRNPLAPLRNALALLGPEDPDLETVRWARDVMGRQVRQMLRLVDDLFDLSRIMQGKLDLRSERVELASIIADALETARPVIDAKGHALTVSVPEGSIELEADPIRLAQAITNLVTNAAKYSGPGGRITVTASREGAEAVISVRDEGVGIAPEMLPRIFDLFMQDGLSSDFSQGGLGVGLALVKSLVEMHGGTVQARSEGPGRGSEFLVSIPIPSTIATLKPEAIRNQAGSKLPRHRILVVDDNEDSANVLGRMLTRLYGQEVKVAHDGPSALILAEEFRPEVILLDIGLPGMDGYEVASRLRRMPGFESVTLMALTGWGQEGDRQKSREAGFDQHLVKPVDPETIMELLQKRGP